MARKSPSVARSIKLKFGNAAYEAYKRSGAIPSGYGVKAGKVVKAGSGSDRPDGYVDHAAEVRKRNKNAAARQQRRAKSRDKPKSGPGSGGFRAPAGPNDSKKQEKQAASAMQEVLDPNARYEHDGSDAIQALLGGTQPGETDLEELRFEVDQQQPEILKEMKEGFGIKDPETVLDAILGRTASANPAKDSKAIAANIDKSLPAEGTEDHRQLLMTHPEDRPTILENWRSRERLKQGVPTDDDISTFAYGYRQYDGGSAKTLEQDWPDLDKTVIEKIKAELEKLKKQETKRRRKLGKQTSLYD